MVAAGNLQIPSPAEVDYKVGFGKQIREALAGRKDIDWQAVRDNYHAWVEHKTTFNGSAKLLVACVLTVATQGMGTEWLAGHGIAEGTAMNAALSAGIQAVAVGAGTSLAGNLGDIGKTFDALTSSASLKHLAATMLTAGGSQALDGALHLAQAPANLTETLKKGAADALVKSSVDTTLIGGSLGENFAKNMRAAAVDAGAAQVAHQIGEANAEGKLSPIAHKSAHAALGATSAALKGQDATSGAIGAVVSETAAEVLHKDGKDPATTAAQARIIGDTVAFLAGRDVASAGKTGTYEELKKLIRGYGHYIEAHEIPSWAALKHNGSTKPRGKIASSTLKCNPKGKRLTF